MKKYYYDLHIHSCLSPCGDNEATPNSIAGMGKINGLDIMALTDHNTCKNCPAFFEAAKRYGILPIAGMELTTAEEIHMVCLFESLEKAMEFDEFVSTRRMIIPNRVDIFGQQIICDSEDNVIGNEEYLLSVATDISVDEAIETAEKFGGICYPAHIDRESNGMVAILGTVPEDLDFSCVEIRDSEKADEYKEKFRLHNKHIIFSSDAHYLHLISEKLNSISLEEITNPERTGEHIIKFLRDGV